MKLKSFAPILGFILWWPRIATASLKSGCPVMADGLCPHMFCFYQLSVYFCPIRRWCSALLQALWDWNRSVSPSACTDTRRVHTVSKGFSLNGVFRAEPGGTAKANPFLCLNSRPVLSYLDSRFRPECLICSTSSKAFFFLSLPNPLFKN